MSIRPITNLDDNEFYQKAVEAIVLAKSPALLNNTADPSALIVKELTNRLFISNSNTKKMKPVGKRKTTTTTTNTNDKGVELSLKYLLSLLSAAAPGLVQKEAQETSTRPDYTYSISDEIPKNEHVCTNCGDTFKNLTTLRRHEKCHNPKPKQLNICGQCGKGFARKDALKRHYNTMICQRNRAKFLSLKDELKKQ